MSNYNALKNELTDHEKGICPPSKANIPMELQDAEYYANRILVASLENPNCGLLKVINMTTQLLPKETIEAIIKEYNNNSIISEDLPEYSKKNLRRIVGLYHTTQITKNEMADNPLAFLVVFSKEALKNIDPKTLISQEDIDRFQSDLITNGIELKDLNQDGNEGHDEH